MHTILHVLIPETVDSPQLQDVVHAILEPHRLKHDDTIQPDWKFDYLCLPEPTLNCAATEAELPVELQTEYAGRISKAHRLRSDVSAGAIVTPSGKWHDLFDFGYRCTTDRQYIASNGTALREWKSLYHRILHEFPDSWVIELDAHS